MIGIWRAFRKTLREKPELLTPVVFIGLVFAVIAAGLINYALNPPPSPPPETAERAKARQAEEAARAAAWAQEQAAREKQQADASARRAESCGFQALCRKYAQARQDCATAGNYDLCMSVKTGSTYLQYACTDDGKVINAPPNDPGRVECAISDFIDVLRR